MRIVRIKARFYGFSGCPTTNRSALCRPATGRPTGDARADLFAADGPQDVAVLPEVEDKDRHVVLHAVGDRRAVHNAEVPLADGRIVELAIEHRVRIPLGVVAVNTIDACRLEQNVGLQLQRALSSGG